MNKPWWAYGVPLKMAKMTKNSTDLRGNAGVGRNERHNHKLQIKYFNGSLNDRKVCVSQLRPMDTQASRTFHT